MKAGIISDTHDLLRTEVVDKLRGCECILHGGDISSRAVLDQLKQLAPVLAVRGNNYREWAEELPMQLDFRLETLHICMAHKKKDLPGDLSAYDLAICGHTHQYASGWKEHGGGKRTLVLNPGSCGPRRLIQPVTMAMLETGRDGWTVERIDIPHSRKEEAVKIESGDIRRQVETVMREMQKGMTVDAIAGKHRLDPALTEQIARLYVTHPGVTAEGIMTKLGLLGKL